MSPMSNDELKRSKAALLALVEKGPKPSVGARRIADRLLNALSDGFKPGSRAVRLAGLLRVQFESWFAEHRPADPEVAKRQKTAMLGGIRQLADLVARQRLR